MAEEIQMIGDRPMLRYWVEATYDYYPNGGMDDIKGRYATMAEAEARVAELKENASYSYIEIYDVLPMLTGDS